MSAKMSAAEQRATRAALMQAVRPVYFTTRAAALDAIRAGLEAAGIILTNNDRTPADDLDILRTTAPAGSAIVDIAAAESATETETGIEKYEPYSNAAIVLYWYEMTTGRVEITAYLS